jgi:hypothetical protein
VLWPCGGAKSGEPDGGPDLLVMDMGEFEVPNLNIAAASDPAAAAAEARAKALRRAARAAAKSGGSSSSVNTAIGGESVDDAGGKEAHGKEAHGKEPRGDQAAAAGPKPWPLPSGAKGGDKEQEGAKHEGGKHSKAKADGGGDAKDGEKARAHHGLRRHSASDADANAEGRQLLRVFSVLPPCLAERARAWGGHLAIKEGWRQTDRGFFDAPGATFASGLGALSAGDGGASIGYELMPAVTVVFASVEGAKSLLRWRRGTDNHVVSRLLRRVMLAALDAVPGSYLCREQEGDLKYMLAFPSASRALQWCLIVQEAAMYAPWPATLLGVPEYAEVHAPGDGTLLFRGPRLKMGACEGVPRGVMCDHVGRVDYHGASVNQAARYMDAAAHGGQVVCDAPLAAAVFRCGGREAQGPQGGPKQGCHLLAPPASASSKHPSLLTRRRPPLPTPAPRPRPAREWRAGDSGEGRAPMAADPNDPPTLAAHGTPTSVIAAAAARLRSIRSVGLGTSPTSGGSGPFSRTNSTEDPMSSLVLRQSSMVALRTPSVRWSDYAARDTVPGRGSGAGANGAADGGGANGAADGGGTADAGGGGGEHEDHEHRVTPRTFSGTELTRTRPGSLMRPGGLVRPPIPILKQGSGSSAGGARRRSDDGDSAPFSQPLARLGSGSYYPEEDPWPAAAAPLDVNTLRQLSAQRLAARQLSWTNAGLNIAAGVPGLDRVPGLTLPAAGAHTASDQGRGGMPGVIAGTAGAGGPASGAQGEPRRAGAGRGHRVNS